MFFNETFGKCLNYVYSFIKSYCVSNSKLVLNYDSILSERGSATSILLSSFVSSSFDLP